jgi:hypothetical protein
MHYDQDDSDIHALLYYGWHHIDNVGPCLQTLTLPVG